MNLIQNLQAKLTSLGVPGKVDGGKISIERPGLSALSIKSDAELDAAYAAYRKARSLSFSLELRELTHNNSFEVLVTRLSVPMSFQAEPYLLSDSVGNTVRVGTCSPAFSFAFLDSSEYEKYFDAVLRRRLMTSVVATRKPDSMLWSPVTATYVHKGRKTPPRLREMALDAIRGSLFKIAAEQNDCYAVWKQRNRKVRSTHGDSINGDNKIPRARYEEDVVSFYKVAKASPFPSQSFLAYYHVIEFFFLKVAETKLHSRLSAILNSPTLRSDRNSLDKVIALVRGQDSRSDETEMLRGVLDAYVQEQDVIDFVIDMEARVGEKIYSKRRRVFGEDIQITPIKDHALANSAKTLKHIRNAIVHSSDRYKREDCHIPLSDTEDLIAEFIPLIRFLAEQVIYGSAG
jgi:hypothetical protein